MEFRILGPLEVVRGSRRLELGGPKQRAVLAALVLEPNRVVPLYRLLDQLWGDEPPPRATATLQAYVSNLRRILEPHRRPRAPATALVTQAPGYLLRVAPGRIDFLVFEALATKGRQLLADGKPRAARDAFTESLALWRGRALADLLDERFSQLTATRLEDERLDALEGRIDAELALGQHAAIIPELEHLVTEHPYRERFWYLLLLSLYRAGRQADALTGFQRVRALFSEDLGIDPGAALRTLEGEILQQSPSLDWKPPVEEVEEVERTGTEPSEPPMISSPAPAGEPGQGRLPIVGRDPQLAHIESLAEEVDRGRGRLLLLSGEPGIGKSRLAEEFAAKIASTSGAKVAWGRSYEGEGSPAFWPWIQVFRRFADVANGRGAASLSSEVERLLGGDAMDGDELADLARQDPAAARARLYDSASRLLIELAAIHPIVIIVDDLQWADVPSLELLQFLAPQMTDARILVIGIHRDVELSAGAPLAQALGALAREPVVRRMSLSGLSKQEVAELFREVSDASLGSSLVETVHDRTEGNPFFVWELIRLIDSEGRLQTPQTLAHAIPAGVRDVVRRRVARLPERTVTVLTSAAVIGREFDFLLLERVCGLPQESALDHIEAALMTGMIADVEGRVGRYRFAHDLVREALSAELSGLRKARLHARVATVLEALHGAENPDHILELAGHMWEGRIHLDPARVAAALIRGSEVAFAQLDYDHARVQLERSIEIMRAVNQTSEPSQPEFDARVELELDAQSRLVWILLMTHGYGTPELRMAADRVRELAAHAGETSEVVGVMWALWSNLCVRAEFRGALDVADQLTGIGKRTGDRCALAAGAHARGQTLQHLGDPLGAQECFREAADHASQLSREDIAEHRLEHMAVIIPCQRAVAPALLGRGEEAERHLKEALTEADRSSRQYDRAFARFFHGWVYFLLGDLDASVEWSSEAFELSDRHGFRLLKGLCGIVLGVAETLSDNADLRRAGEDQGVARAEAALEEFRSTGARMLEPYHLALLAQAYLHSGRDADAGAALEEGIAASKKTGEAFYLSELFRLRARLLMQGSELDRDEALVLIERAVRTAEGQGATTLARRAQQDLHQVSA
jgi:DNA-binding SARP family transcriptional activator